MKTLEAFWRWVDNEKPGTPTVIQKACGGKALTPLARTAIDQAADVVATMYTDGVIGYSLRGTLDHHRDDLRDVSFALLPALEKVVERRELRKIHTEPTPETRDNGFAALVERVVKANRKTLQCAGCGLLNADEPSVCKREDGPVRCNDCQQNHRAAIVQTTVAPPQPLKCGRCDGSGVSPHFNIAGASVTCGRCLGTGGATAPLPPAGTGTLILRRGVT